MFHPFSRCDPTPRTSPPSLVVACGASIASRCQAPPIGAGGMVGAEVRNFPRPCRQLYGTAFSGSRQRAQSSKLAPALGGRCSLELWGFSRASGWLGGPGKRSRASGTASSGHPTRPLASHVLAAQGVCVFEVHLSPRSPLLFSAGGAGRGCRSAVGRPTN